MHTQSFEQLPMPRQQPQAAAGNYRVYTPDGNFVMVHAMNAIEALRNCGVPNVARIERDSLDLTKVFAPNAWETESEASQPAPENAAAEAVDASPAEEPVKN